MKSLFKVIISNFWVMLMGILITLIIPKYLGPTQYGFYQLYVFYASFLGLLLLGYCDGIYLKFGGVDYKGLDKKEFSQYFNFLAAYLIVLSLSLYFILDKIDIQNQNLAKLLSITLFIQGLNSYFVLINQASGRFGIYSLANILEKSTLLIYAVFVFFSKNINLDILLIFTILGKLLTLIINILFDYSIVFTDFKKPFFPKKNIIIQNIKIGFPLTLAGVASMLMTGIGKNKVQNNLGIRDFGYYSLVFSMMSIISQIISAISIVFYPLLKKQNRETMKNNLFLSNLIFEYINILFPFAFYAIYIVLYYYLPNYLPAKNSLIILMPTLYYQSKISIIYNTFMKVLRLEKYILMNGIVALIFCIVITNLGFFILPIVESIAFCTLISFIFWEILSKMSVNKKFQLPTKFFSVGSLYFSIYLTTALYLPVDISFYIYVLFVVIYVFIQWKKILGNLQLILKYKIKRS